MNNKTEQLETLGMLNWSHSIPNPQEKEVFENILDMLPPNPKVLEIGSYTGTSLIAMKKRRTDINITAVDIWDLSQDELNMVRNISERKDMKMSDVKQAFFNNIRKAGIHNEVKVIESRSLDALRKMMIKGDRYDFIYIDGSHLCLDVLADIILSWEILSPGGVMGMDDYLWSPQPCTDLNHPEHAVNWFGKNYKSEFILLYSGYRVFAQKRK
jgi:predicted O-methyltransferase YrrM